MNAQLSHPTKAELSAFALGKLPEDTSDTIEHHLAECDTCSATLASVADDTLIGLLVEPEESAPCERAWIDGRLNDPEQTTAHAESAVADLPEALANHPRYRVLRLLGRGGMGDVYLAEHRLMERPVAVKVMKQRLMGRPDAVERFRREVKAAAQLKHEHIVTAYDAEQAGDLHLLVMEYVDGHDLASEVKSRGSLPVHEACDFARQTALGLAHAHGCGMVHRDIKPHNLMLVDGQVKILDFGLAQVVQAVAERPHPTVRGEASSLTSIHSVLGTPDYIAPEQIHDAHAADHRADLYSLGATLYFLLTGRPPFSQGSATERIESHLSREPADIRVLRPDIPEELAQVVRRLMAKAPSQRYQTAAAAAAALAPFCREPATATSAPALASGGYWNWAIAPLLAALFAGGVWGFWQIVVTIRDRAGNETEVEVPDVERITIAKRGDRAEEASEGEYAHPGHPQPATHPVRLTAPSPDIVLGRHQGPVYDVAFSRDGKLAASAGSDETIRVWGVEDGREIARFDGHRLSEEARRASPGHGTLAVAFTPDGQNMLSGGWDGTGRLWEIATGEEVSQFGPHSRLVYAVDISPDGKIAATAHSNWEESKDPELNQGRLWDIETGELLHALKGHEHGLTDISFSPDGRLVATSSPDATVRVWDVQTGKTLHVLRHATKVHEARFSPDGKTIAAACAGMVVTFDGKINDPETAVVVLWDTETGRQIRTLRGHAGSVRGLDHSPDGRYIVSASGLDHLGSEPDAVPSVEYSIRVWDVETGTELLQFSSATPLHRVRFSPDGSQILSCDEHSAVRLWDLPEKLAVELTAHPAPEVSGERPIAAAADPSPAGNLLHEPRVE